MKILITGGSGFIGTNLIDLLASKSDVEIFNLDKNEPMKHSHRQFWTKSNIMEKSALIQHIGKISPDVVIHLAARTDTASNDLNDYSENTIGTANIVDAVETVTSVKHLIAASTQYVYKSLEKPIPDHDEVYIPHTVYGESKAISEKYIRSADLHCAWTIIRPGIIWGPWHLRYPKGLWRLIKDGQYFHPSTSNVIKTYGYVKNVVHQIFEIAKSEIKVVNKKTFYLGDPPIESYLWLNELSKNLRNKEIKLAPLFIFKLLSVGGDLLRRFRIPFPMYSERLHNMIDNYPGPTQLTINEFGLSHPNLSTNVKESIEWINGEGSEFFKNWNLR